MVYCGPIHPIEFKDVRDFFSAVADHKCEKRKIVSKDQQGNAMNNTFIGFECQGCATWWKLGLPCVKAIQEPMRPYVTTTADRAKIGERLDTEPQEALYEMRNSGGWAQPDPGVAFMTMLAAAAGPPGNPMHKKLDEMMKGKKPE